MVCNYEFATIERYYVLLAVFSANIVSGVNRTNGFSILERSIDVLVLILLDFGFDQIVRISSHYMLLILWLITISFVLQLLHSNVMDYGVVAVNRGTWSRRRSLDHSWMKLLNEYIHFTTIVFAAKMLRFDVFFSKYTEFLLSGA